MEDIKRWFGWVIAIVPIHIAEQLLTGLDELYELQGQVAYIQGFFPNPDFGTVILVAVATLLLQGFGYGILAGGRARLVAMGIFGVTVCAEVHHIAKTLLHLRYFPGAVSAAALATVGVFLVRAVAREFRRLHAEQTDNNSGRL